MKHLGDITRLNGAEIEPADVITGGSPCQDLSVAGTRAGLAGERSGLFREQMRVVREMREATRGESPRFMVWENVPGALSSNRGRDFGEVLNECVKISEKDAPDVPVPEKGWPKAGVLHEEMGRWSIAWRIHDAQFWGVPQRRRRIALVCDFGGMSAPEVLFEREGVRGDSATRGASGQGAAGNLGGSPEKTDAGRVAFQLVGVNSNSMKSNNPHSGCYETAAAGTITANGCEPNNQGGTRIVERRVYDPRGNGNGSTCATVTGDHESSITDYTNLAAEPVAFDKATIEQRKPVVTADGKAPTLIAKGPGGVCAPTFCVGNGQAHVTSHVTKEVAQALNCMHEPMQIATPREDERYVVRRLTPLECTRLQGYPDGWVDLGDWTDTKGRTRKEADAPKYKALGNSIALPFWKWLLERIYDELAFCTPEPTLGSLFDGIGGFPLSWPGETVWSSEIEEFPLAVLRARLGEDDDDEG